MVGNFDEELDKAKREIKLSQLTITDYKKNIEMFYEEQPFFYDRNRIFWVWNQNKKVYEISDETDILNLIDKELRLNGLTVNQKIKNAYIEAFKQVGRDRIPLPQPEFTIQIGWDVINIKDNTITQATPNHFYCNAIPWQIGDSNETPVIDSLLEDWGGKTQKNALYEVLAYCMYQKTPIQVLIALVGTGRNGKSKYIELLTKFLGRENVTTSDLQKLLKNRFEAAKTYKKLACIIGETNYDVISETATLKQMTGDSMIGFEYKNKNPFDDYFYTKIIMASNGLPNTQDLSEGYMRRWLILNFHNTFPEGHDVLEKIPPLEYNNLARKLIHVLKELLGRGCFTGQGTIEERKEKYIMNSNPLILFLQEYCDHDEEAYMKAGELYHQFVNFLRLNKKRLVKRKNFNQLLAEEGLQPEHCKKLVDGEYVNSYWILGLRLKQNLPQNTLFTPSPLYSSYIYKNQVENTSEKGNFGVESDDFNQIINILLDKPSNECFLIDLLNLGFSSEIIEKSKNRGDIIEIKTGILKLNN